MNDAISSSVAVSFGSRGLKRMTPSRLTAGPGSEHQPEHQQRVDEDRPDQRGLGDDRLVGLQREQHDEELGQVADRRLQDRR